MPRRNGEDKTRQVYASIREDLYLAAKARAAELRVPLREFVEMALDQALSGSTAPDAERQEPSVWDDEYLRMQARQPVGSPVELSREEAEKVVRASFGAASSDGGGSPQTDAVR